MQGIEGLKRQGLSIQAISKLTGYDRKTVRKYLLAPDGVPNDLDSVKVPASAPAVLDLYMWLSYRCFKAKGPESIPIFGPFGLVAQPGSVEYSCPRRFRGMLEQWLGVIRAMWPACPAKISRDGQRLLIGHAPAVGSVQIRGGSAID